MFDSREGQNCFFFPPPCLDRLSNTHSLLPNGETGLIPRGVGWGGGTQPVVHKNWGCTSTTPSGTTSWRRDLDEENDNHNIIITIISLFKAL